MGPCSATRSVLRISRNPYSESDASGAVGVAKNLDIPRRSFYRCLDQRSINYRNFLQTLRYQLVK